jgi:hypothetical protein
MRTFRAGILVRKLSTESPHIQSSSASLKSNSLSPYASQNVVVIIFIFTFIQLLRAICGL